MDTAELENVKKSKKPPHFFYSIFNKLDRKGGCRGGRGMAGGMHHHRVKKNTLKLKK